MRFCIGKVPPNEEFHPDRGSRQKVREPSFATFYALGIPIAAITAVALMIAITSVGDESAKIVIKPGDVMVVRVVVALILAVVAFFAVLAIHEIVHLIAHPRMGLSNDSVLGIMPTRGVAYAHYDGEISRNRFLFVIALPFIVLSLGPVALFWITGRVDVWLAFLAIFNGLGSCFDILVIALCLAQLPNKSVLRNKGWETYWRPQEASYDSLNRSGGWARNLKSTSLTAARLAPSLPDVNLDHA